MEDTKCKHNFRTREELEKLHTKQLLNSRITHYPRCDNYYYSPCSYWAECKKEFDDFNKLVKEILATRPHVPNKQESKAIRKAKIKKGR